MALLRLDLAPNGYPTNDAFHDALLVINLSGTSLSGPGLAANTTASSVPL